MISDREPQNDNHQHEVVELAEVNRSHNSSYVQAAQVVNNNNNLSDISVKRAGDRGNFIFRQELKDMTPECDSMCAIVFNIFLSLLFVALGLPILLLAGNITEIVVDYSDWFLNKKRT